MHVTHAGRQVGMLDLSRVIGVGLGEVKCGREQASWGAVVELGYANYTGYKII